MTVCLTGDVHHMSMETRDQAYMDRTEVEVAIDYAEIAAEFNVPVTLFLTGRTAVEEPERVEQLAAMDNVEIGGHNFWAFDTVVHSAWRAVGKMTGGRVGSWNGPRTFQGWEITKTLNAFAELNVDITSWRDHAYRHDGNTADLLAERGITHFSDAIGPDESAHRTEDLTVVPINTPPDHEHVYHAFRTPEFVSEADFEGPFGTESQEVDAWVGWVEECIGEVQERGDVATVLAHPSCMWLADELDGFESLVEEIADQCAICLEMRNVQPAKDG
jgi:hypothetical protein